MKPIDYAIFQNHGYMGLYGGLKMEDIFGNDTMTIVEVGASKPLEFEGFRKSDSNSTEFEAKDE